MSRRDDGDDFPVRADLCPGEFSFSFIDGYEAAVWGSPTSNILFGNSIAADSCAILALALSLIEFDLCCGGSLFGDADVVTIGNGNCFLLLFVSVFVKYSFGV
jgi:hypothetical protein